MNQPVFNQNSIDRISSPEQLGDYLHVTKPAIWAVLLAIVLLLGSLLVWSTVAAVESYATGSADVRNGVLTLTFDNDEKAHSVELGMNIRVGEYLTPVKSIGQDENGTVIAVADAELPDGAYEARVGYRHTRIIGMLFN